VPADVTDDASMDAAFAAIEEKFGTIDFVVHSVAFANKDELKGSFVDNTTREGFLLAMNISAFSFVDVAKRAAKIMPNGGSLITMTYLGSERTIPNYNTMGVAKAALEAATRYIARDLGPKGIRCNAISAGAMRTLALAGIAGGRGMIAQGRAFSAMKEDTSMEGVAGARCGWFRTWALDHGRSRPRRRRLPHDGHAGRGGSLVRPKGRRLEGTVRRPRSRGCRTLPGSCPTAGAAASAAGYDP
jgi:enoyl-[acyl-carrier-protein] reductase (NADH)